MIHYSKLSIHGKINQKAFNRKFKNLAKYKSILLVLHKSSN